MQELDEVLQHFGVKGMKWGVRKEDRSTRRDLKVQKLVAKADNYRREIDNLQSKDLKGIIEKRRRNSKVESLTKKETQAIKDATAKSQGKLTRREKQVLIGAAVVAVAAGYVVGSKIQSGEMNRLAMKGEAYLKKADKPEFKKSPLFARDFNDPDLLHSVVTKGINDHSAIGGKVNCRRCTLTYEMRRRGYDVKATRTTTGNGQTVAGLYNSINADKSSFVGGKLSMLKTMYKEIASKTDENDNAFTKWMKDENMKSSKYSGLNPIKNTSEMGVDIFKSLSKQPDKARGELAFTWKGGGAHSVAWEIVNKKPVIFDTQTGEMFKDAGQLYKYAKHIDKAATTRLDNVELNEDFLMRWMKNVK